MNLIDASQYRKMLPYIEWEGDGGNVLGAPDFSPFVSQELNRPHMGRFFAHPGPLRVRTGRAALTLIRSGWVLKADL